MKKTVKFETIPKPEQYRYMQRTTCMQLIVVYIIGNFDTLL